MHEEDTPADMQRDADQASGLLQLAQIQAHSDTSDTVMETGPYTERTLVDDEGQSVGDFGKGVSVEDCQQKCTDTANCKSFAICTPPGNCHLKDKQISSNDTEKTNSPANSWVKAHCKTYFQPVCKYGGFGQCSKRCNSGVQTRAILSGSDPTCPTPASQECNTHSCGGNCRCRDGYDWFGNCKPHGMGGLGHDCHKHNNNRGGCEHQKNVWQKHFCIYSEHSSAW